MFRIKLGSHDYIFEVSLQFLSEWNNIFHENDLKDILFYVKLIGIGKKHQKIIETYLIWHENYNQ